jgi:hypothetical protein
MAIRFVVLMFLLNQLGVFSLRGKPIEFLGKTRS